MLPFFNCSKATPQAFYRWQLPHLQYDDRPHFVTFCSYKRSILPDRVRFLVLESCLHDNGRTFDLRVAVVMRDHVHMIFMPLLQGTGLAG
jgi:REP element-mobilizing transposase RayT